MKIKIYLFRLAVGLTAFIAGVGLFSAAQYFESVFQTQNQEAVAVKPVISQEIVLAPLVAEPPVTAEQSTNDPEAAPTDDWKESAVANEEFDVTGDYYIYNTESKPNNLPKAFEDFNEISIITTDYAQTSEENNYQGAPIPPEGSVFTKKEYKFVRINIANRQIAFQTETKKGISYKFIGKFPDYQNPSVNGEYYGDLEGRLIKMRDGKKIAETKIRLIAGGC
jgi:hypothetical protein